MRIYVAAPLFNTAEREFNAAFAARLRAAGHELFLPQAEPGSVDDPAAIFRRNMAGLEWSECVVGVADGLDPDSGTAWELGWAHATGRPIVLLRTDFRHLHASAVPYNLMLTESAAELVHLATPTLDEAADAVLAALGRVEAGR